ncbi:hypothetical protein D3C80_2001280 [compost metagenome]
MHTVLICIAVERIPIEQMCLVYQHAAGESDEANSFSKAPDYGPSMLTRLSFLDSYETGACSGCPINREKINTVCMYSKTG